MWCHHSSFLLSIDRCIWLIVASLCLRFLLQSSHPINISFRPRTRAGWAVSCAYQTILLNGLAISFLLVRWDASIGAGRRNGSASGLAIVFNSFVRSIVDGGRLFTLIVVLLTPIKPSSCTLRVALLPTDFSLSFYSAPNSDWNVLVSLPPRTF